MNRAYPIPGRGAQCIPIGDVEFGALCDPGIPCRPYAVERVPQPFVHAVTVPDGYLVRVDARQLAVIPARLRDRPSQQAA